MKIAHIVLAGGRSRRLRPLTWLIPKALMPIGAGQCLLDHWIHAILAHKRIADVIPIVIGGYLLAPIKKYVQRRLPEALILDAQDTGTGGALVLCWKIIANVDAEIFVISACDHYHQINYGDLVDHHIYQEADITLVCTSSEELRHDYLVSKGRRIYFAAQNERTTHAYTGIVVISRRILERQILLTKLPADLTDDFVKPIIKNNFGSLYHENGVWEDLGTWPRYLQHLLFCKGENK